MKKSAFFALPLTAALFLSACGSDAADTPDTTVATEEAPAESTPAESTPAETTAAAAETTVAAEGTETTVAAAAETTVAAAAAGASLAGVCPETIVIQTDWNPEAEHGAIYQLVGASPEVDTDKKRVTGPLMDGTTDTGVKVEIRIGGPAIAFESVVSTMYKDQSITLGYVSSDDAVSQSEQFPTVAIVSPLNKNPQIIMWDPEKYPDAKTIGDLPKDVKVRVFGPAAYLSYLVNTGLITKEQIDGSYKGNPAAWVADNGTSAQQGFASAEPYFYEKELKEWAKPVAYQLIHDAGWDAYAAPLAVRAADLEKNKECFKALVPVVQRATRDYITSPAKTNALILDLVTQYNTGWVYTAGQAQASVEYQLKDGIVANGPDGTLGSFDQARLDGFIAKATPVFEADGLKIKAGLKFADLVTNEFIDPSIKLP
jgi:hypothetical protein